MKKPPFLWTKLCQIQRHNMMQFDSRNPLLWRWLFRFSTFWCICFQPGWYVTVHIANVPRAFMGEYMHTSYPNQYNSQILVSIDSIGSFINRRLLSESEFFLLLLLNVNTQFGNPPILLSLQSMSVSCSLLLWYKWNLKALVLSQPFLFKELSPHSRFRCV